MKEKSIAILTCILAIFAILGLGYAQWNDTVTIASTLQFGYWNSPNLGFIEPLECYDNELTKDIGKHNCYYVNEKVDPDTGLTAYNKTVIEISYAYPGYIVYCNLTIQNIGTTPTHINGTKISDPTGSLTWNSTLNALTDENGKPIIKIDVKPDPVCNTLASKETMNIEIEIEITQNANPFEIYQLQVEIFYEEGEI